jgi:hypothetical protein
VKNKKAYIFVTCSNNNKEESTSRIPPKTCNRTKLKCRFSPPKAGYSSSLSSLRGVGSPSRRQESDEKRNPNNPACPVKFLTRNP